MISEMRQYLSAWSVWLCENNRFDQYCNIATDKPPQYNGVNYWRLQYFFDC